MSASASEARTIPSQDIIEKAAELEIYDVDGTKLKFGSLFEDRKVVVVFIRHFYCSSCQDYAAHLARIPKEALDNAGTQIVLIGSGNFQPIKFYAETTSFPGPIYANPSRSLFKLFGMTYSTKRTPSGEPKREYAKDAMPVWRSFFKALYDALTHPSFFGKQGHGTQLGGDFIFGPGIQCTFASRMRHVEDHVEVSELMEAAGVVVD